MVTTWRHINSHLLQVPSCSGLLTVMANTHFFNLHTTRNASQRWKQSTNSFMLSHVRSCTTKETYQNKYSHWRALQIYQYWRPYAYTKATARTTLVRKCVYILLQHFTVIQFYSVGLFGDMFVAVAVVVCGMFLLVPANPTFPPRNRWQRLSYRKSYDPPMAGNPITQPCAPMQSSRHLTLLTLERRRGGRGQKDVNQ